MRKGELVKVRTPRNGLVREGRFVAKHATHTGQWLEIKPLEKGKENFRVRPAMLVTD